MNETALSFIKTHEGCRLACYLDGGGKATIGYGATGPSVKMGLTWTQSQADARLASDIQSASDSLATLLARYGLARLSEQQEAALLSLIFNIGEAAFSRSTLLQYLRSKQWLPVAREFPKWDHDNGKEVKGLLIRRFEEAALFLKGSP